jgi:hypothetical protein
VLMARDVMLAPAAPGRLDRLMREMQEAVPAAVPAAVPQIDAFAAMHMPHAWPAAVPQMDALAAMDMPHAVPADVPQMDALAAMDMPHARRAIVNQATVAAAIAVLQAGDQQAQNRASELTCPVSHEAYSTEEPYRPVRWNDGNASIVMSASMVTEWLSRPAPLHPYSGRVLSPGECRSIIGSAAFLQGDGERLALVRAACAVMQDGGPEQGRLDRLLEAMQAAVVPEWQRYVRAPEGAGRAGAGAGAALGL